MQKTLERTGDRNYIQMNQCCVKRVCSWDIQIFGWAFVVVSAIRF